MTYIYQGSRIYMGTHLTEEKMKILNIPYKVFDGELFVEVVEEERTLSFNPKDGFKLSI